jgi:hypothetical protein
VNASRPPRVVFGLLVASLTAPLPTTIAALALLGIEPREISLRSMYSLLLLVGPSSIIASGIGILLIGLPCTWLLRRLNRLSILSLATVAALAGPALTMLIWPEGWAFSYSRTGWTWVAALSSIATFVAIVFGIVNRLSWRVPAIPQNSGLADG